MKKLFKRVVLLACVIGIYAILQYLQVTDYLSLTQLKLHGLLIKQQVKNYSILGPILYILVYALSGAFALPGTFVITMAGGYFFGVFPGIVYILIGATLGATSSFLFARYLIGEYVQRRYSTRLATINEELAQRGIFYLLSLRLVLVLPFFMVNLLLGLTQVSVRDFVWTTAMGIIPASLLFAFAGKQLKRVESVYDIFSYQVLLIFLCIACLVLIPVFFRPRQKN